MSIVPLLFLITGFLYILSKLIELFLACRPTISVRYLKWYDGVYEETLTFWDIDEWERVIEKTELRAPDVPVGTYFSFLKER